ncbi:radical SAM protein, partial [Myxococcota bacterium]|nr:radical SAM protein [Myxococcota bacterium]
MSFVEDDSIQIIACNNPELPSELALLPLNRGKLLVSRSHAVFCRISLEDLPLVMDLATSRIKASDLPQPLHETLTSHGFFSPPRPAKPEPQTVQIQITNRCNLLCSYCCTNSGEPREREISLETVREVLTTTREKLGPGIRVAILGGEPLLVPWALEAADFGASLGLDVTLFSNGVPLASQAMAEQCARSCARGVKFRISLAGPTRELCDDKSGNDRFDAVVTGLNNLYRFGGEAIIDLMLFPEHVDEVASHLHHLRGLLPPGIVIAFGIAYVSGREVGANLFESHQTMEEA